MRTMSLLGRDLPAGLAALRAERRILHAGTGAVAETTRDVRGPYFCHNPSVTVHAGQLWAVIRVRFATVPMSRNILGRLDDNLGFVDGRWMRDKTGAPRQSHAMCRGFEDCRLFSWRGRLMACATACDLVAGDGGPKLAVLTLDDHGSITQVHVQHSSKHEKNWMPLVDGDRLRFVYSVDPSVVLDYDEQTRRVHPPASECPAPVPSALRGGSQLVAYGDGFVAVTHQVHAAPNPRSPNVYVHRFVQFDKDARPTRRSAPFFFQHHGLEFCAGLVEHQGRYLLAYGAADKEAHVAVVARDVVEELLGRAQ
jgi:hypothetical protein